MSINKFSPVLLRASALAALVLVLLSVPAHAGVIAFTASGDTNSVYRQGSLYVLGWQFTIAAPIQVTSLGFWDYEGNGFEAATGGTTSSDVGIWNLSQSLLTSVTVLSSDPLSNVLADGSGFHFHSLNSPLTLQAGTFVIGGVAHGESYICYPANCGSFNPTIGFGQGLSAFSDTLVFPGNSDVFGNPGWIGPNFQFENTVPEPGSAWLVPPVLGVLAIVIRKRRAATTFQ